MNSYHAPDGHNFGRGSRCFSGSRCNSATPGEHETSASAERCNRNAQRAERVAEDRRARPVQYRPIEDVR
jgi:hypothetical protein